MLDLPNVPLGTIKAAKGLWREHQSGSDGGGNPVVRRTEGGPHNRETRIVAIVQEAIVAALAEHPELEAGGEKLIVFMDGQERSGLVLHGYEDDTEAMVNLFMHLKAIFKANGKELGFMPLAGGPMS